MLGLYIHIPFCVKKCRYCDFVSYENSSALFDKYVNALEAEAKKYHGFSFDTVFIGGGTPTALSSEQLSRLLTVVKENFDISGEAEFTAEANPKTLDEEKLFVLSSKGVNRLSIGVQSFCDKNLSAIGRIHSAKDAEETFCLAKKYFDNINIDLMFSLPGQNLEDIKYTAKKAVSLNPTHISCYSLILEEGTPMYRDFEEGKIILPDEDTDRNNFDYICNFFKENGYNRYEISNFARCGFECRHNLKYWDCDEYIGLGVAAHSYFGGKRFFNTSNLNDYLSGNCTEEEIALSENDMMSEFMIMGLRKTKGISLSEFEKRFSKNPYDVFNIEKFEKNGLIIKKGDNISLSDYGLDVSNSILCEFV